MAKKIVRKYAINATAIICAVVIAVAGIAITIIGTGSNWFTNADIKTWFNSWGKGELGTTEQESFELIMPQSEFGGYMVLSKKAALNAPMAFSAERSVNAGNVFSGNSCTVTATLEPADAYYSKVNWSCDSEDISVTQSEANPLSATVTMLKGLEFPAEITCEVVSIKTVSATCRVDYMSSPTLGGVGVDGGDNLKCNTPYELFAIKNGDQVLGTVALDTEITYWSLELTSSVISAISAELGILTGWDNTCDGDGATLNFGSSPYDMFFTEGFNYDREPVEISKDAFNRAFFKVCNGKKDYITLTVGVSFTYKGVEYFSDSDTTTVSIDSSSYAVGLTGVNIDDVLFTD